MYGYNGKVVYVDLTKKSFDIKDLKPEIARAYLGGTGLSAKIVYDLLSREGYLTLKEDPFSDINPLIFATGPITGTIRPSSGRYTVSGISPLTKIWGEGSSGGSFCISLRNCGYDAIVFLGKATKPIYLFVHNGKIEFKDAFSLQGKDCYETQNLIKNDLNETNIRVACIGLAGENLVKYAVIINDEGRAIGRCGLGAIMGSKNLKALAIQGTNKVEIANKERGKEIRQTETKGSIGSLLFNLYGTNMYLDLGMVNGDTPGYYFTESEFPAEKLTSKTLKEDYPVFNYGCVGCTVKCGKSTIIKENGKEIKVDGPEYESVASFGPLCGLFDSRYVILANHLCNEYGVDTISCGVSIAFLIYLVENNLSIEIIKSFLSDIQLQDIKWGNGATILELIKKITKREGIGKILAEGVRTMAETLEVDPELAAHVKGLEIPMHDPRAFAGQALSYITGVTGANHNKCDWYNTELGSFKYPTLHIKRSRGRYNIKGRERGISKLQDLRAIDDSAVNCNMVRPSLENIIGYINASTGFNYDKKALMEVGERINNLKRLISCNLGITREDDKLPKHLLKTLSFGKTTGVELDLTDNLKKYYSIRGWDWETGRPTDEKLKQLRISNKSE
ncbi:hypothetical protein LCGC14_1110350 [marine sediment metagenome]|uniref:Aldehyde ferredoxin oxidoreductase N-terminal domain-containing protein n=1 Tax=marine sediment metagenome TaxID=412755 RepID=A0A0F9QD18_9ZZZZ